MKKNGLLKMIFGICMCMMLWNIQVFAEEQTISANVLVKTTEDTILYEQPDLSSQQLETVAKDTQLITQETQNGEWISVQHGEVQGYVLTENLSVYHADGVEQEFEKKENALNAFLQEIEYQHHLSQQKKIWGIVIVLLVVAIFAVGISSSVINEKKKKHKKEM